MHISFASPHFARQVKYTPTKVSKSLLSQNPSLTSWNTVILFIRFKFHMHSSYIITVDID